MTSPTSATTSSDRKPSVATLPASGSRASLAGGGLNAGFSEIAMYKLFTDSPAKKTNILKINLSGRFTLNIIDELIVVHHRNSFSSLIFDIKMPGDFDGYTTCNSPIIRHASIQPTELPASALPYATDSGGESGSVGIGGSRSSSASLQQTATTEMYSMNWIMFLPNMIIDAKLGCFWFMELNLREPDLRPFAEFDGDYLRLVEFLLNRKNTKQHVIKVCIEAIRSKVSLKVIEKIFDKINELYKYSLIMFPNLTSSGSTQTNASGQSEVVRIFIQFFLIITGFFVNLFNIIFSSNLTPY